jgi:transglutaminase-like putative cysteine protease/tetratricopeptide (TPR) repeat protein
MRRNLALAAAVLAMTAAAGAQSSLTAPAAQIAAQVRSFTSASSAPVARLVDLYHIRDLAPEVAPVVMQAALVQLQAAPRLEPLVAAEVAAVQAATDLRQGNRPGAAAIWRGLGEVENWQVVGPFDNSGASAIATVEGPEKGPEVDLKARYPGKQRQVGWRRLPYSAALGELDLAAFLTPSKSASAYLVAWVRSPRAQDVALRTRDDGSTRLWVDGQLVFHEQGSHPSGGFDQHAVGAHLAAGWNEILAKVGDGETSDWVFSLRITTPAGAPLALEARATPPPGPPATMHGNAVVAVSDLTADARAAAASQQPAALLAYAWVLKGKENTNSGDHLAAATFQAAIAAAPQDRGAVLDFVEHDSDQSRQYENLERLLAADPTNARAHQDLGSVQLARGELWPARQNFWQALGPAGEAAAGAPPPAAVIQAAPRAALGMVECYAGSGIPPEAEAWAHALRAAGETAPAFAAPIATILERLGDIPAAMRWSEDAHRGDQGDVDMALTLGGRLQRNGQLEPAMAVLGQAIALNGPLPMLLELQARGLAGLGRQPAAIATIRRAAALAPDQPELRIVEGEIERQFGHNAAALGAWRTALALNPQDASLRSRLQLAQGSETAVVASFERPYRQDLTRVIAAYKALPAARRHGLENSGPYVVLADTHVTNIFPSGNTGRYVQQIFRVNNRNGADALALYPVTYDPSAEQVHFLSARVVHPDGSTSDAPQAGDQPVSQSVGYETFYDVRNKYVVMPTMRAGDFVEIAYRILPTTLESLYGNYYGDIDPFGSNAPTLFQQYIVLTPKDKPLYFKPVRFAGKSEVTTRGAETVYRWSERDLPAQIQEPLAPPAIEQSGYIAVSAFRTWDQFANWYRQLIRDTFVINGELAQTVAGLVKGKTTEQQKVDAIYRWVIQNTHYVALEFGIHGYRPYPVTQVFHRRFGDCKDKASLLIAMLHQAGIASEFVLVRIRELGVLDPTIPSVADFDHAIVYVPSLHLYLDGTAEFEGARELPAGDQRAFVFRIPIGADLAADAAGDPAPAPTTRAAASAPAASGAAALRPEVTPEQPPRANIQSRTVNGQLDAQGNLRFSVDMILSGGDAPYYRQSLEVPDRQAGVLQAMLHSQLPGISVVNATVMNDNNWDQPLEISFQGSIPNFASVDGHTLLVPRQFLPVAWLPRMAALATRKTAVLTDPPRILVEQMHLALPPGFHVAGLPPATNLQQPFADFQAAAGVNGNTLSLESRIETRHSLIPPAEYPAFRAFWSQVDAALGRPITLRGGGQ